MKTMKHYFIYILSLLGGVLICIVSVLFGATSSETILALGSGIVTSTIVSLLINAKSERDIERQKKETRDALLQKMSEQAATVLWELLIRINDFYEKIDPEKIVYPSMRGGFMLACLKAHERSEIKEGVLAFNLENIRDGFRVFWRFDLSLEEQPESIRRLFSNLFCKNNSFITTYQAGLGSINSDALFAMGLITEDQKNLLPSYSEINTLRAFQPPSSDIDNLDVANAQLLIDELCRFCKATYEGIWKINNPLKIFSPQKEYAEKNKECAKYLLDELYCWHDRTPSHIVYRNIFGP